MLELVKAGGWPMIPLLLLSALALAIIVERFWALRRKAVSASSRLSCSASNSVTASRPMTALLRQRGASPAATSTTWRTT